MTKFLTLKKSINFLVTLLIFSLFSSCGIYSKAPTSEVPVNDKQKRIKNIEEGRGINLLNKKQTGGDFVFASSNPMWRATLSVLDFTPLSNVDYGGGIIITDWYSDQNNNTDSLKISVQFLANEIRADGIEVSIFKKECSQVQNCQVNKVNTELNQEIKLAILKRAAQIEVGDKKREFEESGRKITGLTSID